MAQQDNPKRGRSPLSKILEVLRLDREEITSVYLYAILSGLIQLSLPLGIQSIISFVLGGSISTSLVLLIVGVVVGVLFTGIVQIAQMRIIEKVQQKLFVRYAFEYAHRIPNLDLKAIDGYHLPETVNRFFDTISLQKGIAKLLLDFPTATIQILFGLILLSFYHPFFIAFSFALVGLVAAILYYSGARGMQTSIEESDYKYSVGAWLEELARVVASFKFSKGGRLHLERTDGLVKGYLDARTSHFRILQLQYWTLVMFKVVITAGMLVVGSFLLIEQQLNLGQFIAAEIVILLVLNSVEKLIINLDKVYDVLTSVEKLSKVIEKPLESHGDVVLGASERGMRISVSGLSFSHADRKVLHDVSFEAPSGSRVAITGGDGSGKSTLLRALCGVYHDYAGGIMADGISLRDFEGDSYRRQTGVLLGLQDIFQGTLIDNITMGDASIRASDIMELAERIGLTDFIRELPSGLSSPIDPVGKRLPRTITQKILLMRALAGRPRLLLLEEPWRGMDAANADRIRKFLLDMGGGSTLIVVSNDTGFQAGADMVLEMQDGRLTMSTTTHKPRP
jgi:ABC-type bacteriocin/lantibiotic exporter with double-glycine peptidase domain